MNFYSCYDLPRAEARIHEKKSNYLKAILENHQNRSTINRKRAADLPYLIAKKRLSLLQSFFPYSMAVTLYKGRLLFLVVKNIM